MPLAGTEEKSDMNKVTLGAVKGMDGTGVGKMSCSGSDGKKR